MRIKLVSAARIEKRSRFGDLERCLLRFYPLIATKMRIRIRKRMYAIISIQHAENYQC